MASLVSLYQKLNKKIKEENSLIKAENFEKLKEILTEKSSLIEKIESKETAIKENKAAKLTEDEFKSLKEILIETAELQDGNMKSIIQKKKKTKTKLLELYDRKKSIKGYYNRGHQEAKFFDEKS